MKNEKSKPAPTRGPEYWREQMNGWRASGLTQAEYCRQNDLDANRFSNWKRRIEQLEKQERRSAARAARNGNSGFVELPLAGLSHGAFESPLIEIGVDGEGRITLRVSPRMNGGR